MSAWMRDFSAFVIHYLSVEICGFFFFLFYLGFYCNVVEILLSFFFSSFLSIPISDCMDLGLRIL